MFEWKSKQLIWKYVQLITSNRPKIWTNRQNLVLESSFEPNICTGYHFFGLLGREKLFDFLLATIWRKVNRIKMNNLRVMIEKVQKTSIFSTFWPVAPSIWDYINLLCNDIYLLDFQQQLCRRLRDDITNTEQVIHQKLRYGMLKKHGPRQKIEIFFFWRNRRISHKMSEMVSYFGLNFQIM